MRESRKFRQRGSKFGIFFLVDEGKEAPNTTLSGHHNTEIEEVKGIHSHESDKRKVEHQGLIQKRNAQKI